VLEVRMLDVQELILSQQKLMPVAVVVG